MSRSRTTKRLGFNKLFDEVVPIIGWEATLELVRAFGGTRLYIPKVTRLDEEHNLVQAIGEDAARKLAKKHPSRLMVIPRGTSLFNARRNEAIRRRFDAGESAPKLALEFGLCERQVRNILNDLPDTTPPPQADLFK